MPKKKSRKGIGGRPRKPNARRAQIGLKVSDRLHGWYNEQPHGVGASLAREGLRVMAHLSPEVIERLQALADERGVKLGELVANIISKCPLTQDEETSVSFG